MPGSSFGQEFRITTFGESHGGAIGVIVEGVIPNILLSEKDVQIELDRRKPGQSSITTPRNESDTVHFMSGIFEGKTTGTPLAMIIYNGDQQPEAYDSIKNLFRPGHADYTYQKKYGIRDYKGSGRASGRETAARVAAGAVAKKILLEKYNINVTAYVTKAGGIECKSHNLEEIEKNIVRACDSNAAKTIIDIIHKAKIEKNSIGGIVECEISGVPPGLGEPVFDKLDADLAKGIMSIGAVKGIEFGRGFAVADTTGKDNNDCMDKNGFLSNNSGGIIGGISNGEKIIFRAAIKPTSSISLPQKTVDLHGNETTCITEGRHDPCICPRIVPVIEAMSAIVIVDHIKRQKALFS